MLMRGAEACELVRSPASHVRTDRRGTDVRGGALALSLITIVYPKNFKDPRDHSYLWSMLTSSIFLIK